MQFKSALFILLFSQLSNWAIAANASWDAIRKTESELKFLEELATFALSAEASAFSEVLATWEELPETRQEVTISVILDQWIRKNPKSLHKAMKERWDKLDPTMHMAYLHLSLSRDAEETSKRLFDDEDPAAQYRGELMYEIIRLNPQRVAKYLSKNPDKEMSSRWSSALVHTWMETSPNGALDWAIANRELVDLQQVFSSLLYSDDPKAKAKLNELWDKLPKDSQTEELARTVANQLIYSDPEAALEFITRLPDEERYPLMHRAMDRMAESKSPRAAEIMQSLPQEHLPRSYTLKKVIMEWGLRQPEKAIEWAESIQDPKLREDALARMNTVLGMRDPQLAVDHALAATEESLRKTLIRNAALILAKSDLAEGLAWLDELPESPGKKLALESISHMTDRLPAEELLAEGLKMKQTPEVIKFVDRAFDRWSQSNIEEAAEWYLSLPESEQNSSRASDVGYQLAARTPDLALEYLFSESTPLGVQKKIYSTYMDRYSERPEMLNMLIDGLRPTHAGSLLSSSELGTLARLEPMMAYELAEQLEERERASAIRRITTSWAVTDPKGLASYLKNVDLDAQYNYATVAEGLANRSYEDAASWVEGLEPGEPLHYGVIGLARHLVETSPAEAFDLMQHFEDEGTRKTGHSKNRTYQDIVKKWAYFDPASAQAAVEDSSLPEKQKDQLIESIRNLEI